MPPLDQETLHGWKQIADYLAVTVRAAQSWEKDRGLPVRRYPHTTRARVYAIPEELDAWMLRRDGNDGSPPISDDVARNPRHLGRGLLLLLAAAVIGIGAVVVLWRTWQGEAESMSPERCVITGRTLMAFDRNGELIWEVLIPELSPKYGPGEPRYSGCTIMDVDGDRSNEILIQFVGQDRFSGGKLSCYRPGEVQPLWEHTYGMPLSRGSRTFSPSFIGKFVRRVSAHGETYLLSIARHTPFFPAVAELLDPVTGKRIDAYVHPGHLYAAEFADVDGDNEPEVLLGGVGNPGAGPGNPVVVVLDLPFSGTRSERRRDVDGFGNEGPREMAYWIFPASETDLVTDLSSHVEEIGVPVPASSRWWFADRTAP